MKKKTTQQPEHWLPLVRGFFDDPQSSSSSQSETRLPLLFGAGSSSHPSSLAFLFDQPIKQNTITNTNNQNSLSRNIGMEWKRSIVQSNSIFTAIVRWFGWCWTIIPSIIVAGELLRVRNCWFCHGHLFIAIKTTTKSNDLLVHNTPRKKDSMDNFQ